MKPRFLADADFHQKIVLGLLRREPTIDFQTASQGGVMGRPDPDVLSIAARENRILISHDRGTMPAHFTRFTATQSSSGLILVSQEIHIGTAIEELLLVSAASSHEEWQDEIRFIPL